MAVSYNPGIVTNGLVLCLDAANRKSYPGTGTGWFDLCQNSVGTLTNGPTFSSSNNGFFSFDGTDDYVLCTGSFTLSQATFICWLRVDAIQAQYDGIMISRSATTTGLNFQLDNQLTYHWNNDPGAHGWQSNLIVPTGTWCMVAASVAPSSATIYVNTSTATNILSHTSTTMDDINIGRDEFSSRLITGNIAVAQIYNRALSSAEMIQNFNALRGRFGI